MQLYNSLSQNKEDFQPISPKNVTMYVCGITPYDTTHLGHAFTYIFFDTLQRYLLYKKYTITYTQNVTDINDRDNDILKRAKEQNVPWQELSTYWIKRFLEDMQKLNWIPPTNYLKASENIEPMVMLIKKIIEHKAGYEVNGNVYLDITRVPDFGKLSRLIPKQMFVRAKEFEEDLDNKEKRHPLDITLWRSSEKNQLPHIPSFDSSLGKGRPGWHLECSAMSISSLAEQIDIHGGGRDLIYPHHESEIAQSEIGTKKKPVVKYWLHTGIVSYKDKKMSKSLGNLIMISDLLKTYTPQAIRWVLLSHHYRESWEFNKKELEDAQKNLDSINNLQESVLKQQSVDISQIESQLDNDMDTKAALLTVSQWVQYAQSANKNEKIKTINKIKQALLILGLA